MTAVMTRGPFQTTGTIYDLAFCLSRLGESNPRSPRQPKTAGQRPLNIDLRLRQSTFDDILGPFTPFLDAKLQFLMTEQSEQSAGLSPNQLVRRCDHQVQ